MHEMVYVHKALDIALDTCERAGARRVTAVHLTVGEVTDIIDCFAQDMFSFLAQDTAAEGARLEIRHVPLMVRCDLCGEEFHLDVRDESTWDCPSCGAHQRYHIRSGREFIVDRVEVAGTAAA